MHVEIKVSELRRKLSNLTWLLRPLVPEPWEQVEEEVSYLTWLLRPLVPEPREQVEEVGVELGHLPGIQHSVLVTVEEVKQLHPLLKHTQWIVPQIFKLLPLLHILFDLVIRFITNRKYAFFCIF